MVSQDVSMDPHEAGLGPYPELYAHERSPASASASALMTYILLLYGANTALLGGQPQAMGGDYLSKWVQEPEVGRQSYRMHCFVQ
jgi:hypothetical protein